MTDTTVITPNPEKDISNRKISQENLDRYTGVPAQILCLTDENYRPIVHQGTTGSYERVLYESDYSKLITPDYSKVTINTTECTLDVSDNSVFNLNLSKTCTITLNPPVLVSEDKVAVTKLIINNIESGVSPVFTDDIRWLTGSTPIFPSLANLSYVIRLYYTSTGWIGELGTSTGSSESTGVIIDSGSYSRTEWMLPAGSLTGDEPDKITDYFFADISDEDKQNMTNISHSISDITNVASALDSISTVEDKLETISTVKDNTSAIQSLAENLSKLTDLVNSLENILDVQKYISNINLVAHHIKDKYFLDVKATTSAITGNTILQLDKITLAPALEGSTGSGSYVLDTDSSDNTISPTLLIYSDTDIADNALGDGTIVVSPTSNKINSVTSKD